MSKRAVILGVLAGGISAAVLIAGYIAGSDAVTATRTDSAARWTAERDAGSAPRADPARTRIETVVRDYLLENPELLIDMQAALSRKQEARQHAAQKEAIQTYAAEIFDSRYDGVVGNPDGDRTIVEFFDYNCGYCARALGDMQAMVEADPDLRFVMKEFPIFGADSRAAHLVSMAVHTLAPDKYAEFHARLLGGQGKADKATAMKIALSLGLDEDALKEAMNDPGIEKAFQQTYDLAEKLEINGTPSYVVGDEVIAGAVGRQALTEKLEMAQ